MCLILFLVAACLEEPIIILLMVRLSFPCSLVAAWGGLYSHGNNQYLPFLATVKLHWLFSFSCWIKAFQAFYYRDCNCQGQCVSLIKTRSRIVSLLCWISFPFACSGRGILYCVTFWISLRSQRDLFVQFLLVNWLLFVSPQLKAELSSSWPSCWPWGSLISSPNHLPGGWAELSPVSGLNNWPGKLVNMFMLLWTRSGASCKGLAWCAATPQLLFNVQFHSVLYSSCCGLFPDFYTFFPRL